MQLYEKLCKAITENEIDELGLLHIIPEETELPLESQVYYPLIVVESKLGISKKDLSLLLKEAHNHFITVTKDNCHDLEQVTRVMVLLKPDNYTAMNRRKELILSGHIDLKRELALIELIFTIPKHSKSSVAWYHRQWIYMHFNQLLDIDIVNEFKLCTMTSAAYPRNYYSWTYRNWILKTYCINNIPLLEREYRDTRHWIETHISDYSGFQYLEQLMGLLRLDTEGIHMKWLDQLIIKYPGHESLWCHRRFCSHLMIHSPDYCQSQHEFISNIINGTFKDQSFSNSTEDIVSQKEFALRFGLWQTLLEKRNRINNEYATLYLTVAPIPDFLNLQE
ncbi:hypothetical protein HPULCUR_009763 [Helicostylum pulchrum]|uniref:Uncharacterized protein n=1 Tax=Helicostylum pulchrum TaxID=562976 RepID=A0ABP9YBF2_9FUNG